MGPPSYKLVHSLIELQGEDVPNGRGFFMVVLILVIEKQSLSGVAQWGAHLGCLFVQTHFWPFPLELKIHNYWLDL